MGLAAVSSNKELATTKSDSLDKLLFAYEGHSLRNIKFFRGTKDVISPSEIRDAVHSAVLMKRTGHLISHHRFLDVERLPVQALELVKSL